MRGIHGIRRSFDDGEVIFHQGDQGDEMYVVTQGAVRIYRAKRGREVELATVGEGEHFGELALLLDAPRSAGARAVGPTTLRAVGRSAFKAMTVEEPLVWDLMRTMGDRIRTLDEQLVELDVQDQVRKEHLSGLVEFHHRFV